MRYFSILIIFNWSRKLQEIKIGKGPAVLDKGRIECPESTNKGDVRNDLITVLEHAKVIDDGFLNVLMDIREATFAIEIPSLHGNHILVRSHKWVRARQSHHVVLIRDQLKWAWSFL